MEVHGWLLWVIQISSSHVTCSDHISLTTSQSELVFSLPVTQSYVREFISALTGITLLIHIYLVGIVH